MIVGIHHVQITIPEGAEAEARAFYCELLGLAEIEKPVSLQERGGFWIRVGERDVHLGVQDNVDRQGNRAHVAYMVSDLEGWRQRLERQGVAVRMGIPIPGYVRFEFRDPFGNRVEFIQALVA